MTKAIQLIVFLVTMAAVTAACASTTPPPETSAAVTIPDTPVGAQLQWFLDQLNSGGAQLNETEVARHFDDDVLTYLFPPDQLIAVLRETSTSMAPFRLEGFAFPPTATMAVALIRGARPGPEGDEAAVYMQVAPDDDQKIVDISFEGRPKMAIGEAPYEGLYDIGGRSIYMSCSGSVGPTVILEGGSTIDWGPIQTEVSGFARVCSYDKPNAKWGRSDPVPGPRTATDAVADLADLLDVSDVPGPYVLVGHSRSGAFVQMFAIEHHEDTAGMVLLDAQHFDYWERTNAMAKEFLDAKDYEEWFDGFSAPASIIGDPLQFDDKRSLEELRAAFTAGSFPQVPLIVITHETFDPSGPPGWAEMVEATYMELQSELAELVPGSSLITAEGSGHDIPADRPDLVVDAIRSIVDRTN